MRTSKKFLWGIGVFSLSLSLLGCNGSETEDQDLSDVTVHKEGFPIVDEPITMTMMAPGTGMMDWEEMPFFQELEKMTNIKFEFVTPPMTDFGTNLNLAFASRDLQDVIFAAGSSNLTRAMEIDYGSQGILIPLEDLIEEYAPNLSRILEENPVIRRNITSPDGHIYSLPAISEGGNAIWASGPLWYNGSWLETLGVTQLPTTTDEFFELMVRFRDEEPAGPGVEVYPISDGSKLQWMRPWFLSAFGMTSRGIEEVDGVVRYNATTDNYRAYLEYMHQLWEEDILDPEIFTQSDDQKKAKGENNQLGVFQDWYSFFTTGEDEVEALKNPMFFPLLSEWSSERVITASPKMSTGTFAITETNPNPAAAIRWVDYFYSEEGNIFGNQGPEGYLWEYVANDSGEQVRVFVEGIDLTNTEEERGKITPFYGITTPGLGVDAPAILVDRNDEPDTRYWDFILEQTQSNIEPYGKVPFPPLALTFEESNTISIPTADITTYLDEMEARFITGVEPINDQTWNEFLETLEQIGSNDLVETYQQAYDRWSHIE